MERFEPMVAIDVATKQEALSLFDHLANDTDHAPIVKIGMELYYAFGPGIVKQAEGRGLRVFLDLKCYDIPNTVKRAMTVIGKLGVSFTTTHAAGGTEMLKAAKEGLEAGAREAGMETPKLLAITQLTSIDDHILHDEQHINLTLKESVQNYARLAEEAGLDGVVCSAQEVQLIREVTGPDFLCVTPGIRPNLDVKDDQKRVMTPSQAREVGSNAIVVGRPITQADNPVTLSPDKPFTWASGLHSPIYTDNRLTISYPYVRRNIYDGMVDLIKEYYPDVEVVAGTATAGIPHAAWVADRLSKPLVYVRSKPKDHGQGKQVEGVLEKGQKVVVIDDLLSTGGSVLKACKAVANEGGEVLGVVAVFSYQLKALDENFEEAGLTYHTVTNYSTLIDVAHDKDVISKDQLDSLHEWRKDPQAWSDAHE